MLCVVLKKYKGGMGGGCAVYLSDCPSEERREKALTSAAEKKESSEVMVVASSSCSLSELST